jgi:hypothetical protein
MRENYIPEPRQSSGLIRGVLLAFFIGGSLGVLLANQLAK